MPENHQPDEGVAWIIHMAVMANETDVQIPIPTGGIISGNHDNLYRITPPFSGLARSTQALWYLVEKIVY